VRQGTRRCIAAAAGCAIAAAASLFIREAPAGGGERPQLKACFIYIGDGSSPYTANFMKAQKHLEEEFPGRVETEALYNVPEDAAARALASLSGRGCGVIFSNSTGYGDEMKRFAADHPDIEFCQPSCDNANDKPVLKNYHTFMGHIHEARYAAGVAAGMKLKELVDSGRIPKSCAKAGYVASYPVPEVISGFTAFILGIRSVVPYATMVVRYAHSWNDYVLEKKLARQLIEDDGCTIISQHTYTTGPAVACEEADTEREVYCVPYNESMSDVAPTTYLTGSRINWTPYVTQAVRALLSQQKIEDAVSGEIHGNDAGSGFKDGWVGMLELNAYAAAKGTEEKLSSLESEFAKGRVHVFRAVATGTDPDNPDDRIDLRHEYVECRNQSAPTFHYILDGIVTVK
jgi:basic membrane lipoprotein Med (substrate-binding protein (PBP1-ABC) superfamily)